MYSLFTSSQGNFPLGEKIEEFQSAPLATITDEAPIAEAYHIGEIVNCSNKK